MARVYYWKTKPNFGDMLTPLLLKKFTKLDAEWASANDAQLVLIGSLLEHLDSSYAGLIAGTGKLKEDSQVYLPYAKVLSVRGPLTAKSFKGDFGLGDPALLADELVPPQEKKYNLGLIPHWSDTDLETRKLFTQFNPIVIRVSDDPITVITQIAQCHKVVSSSLHGIILADALGIPRRIELAPAMVNRPNVEGGLFKWKDYSASIHRPLNIGVAEEVDRNVIIERQHEIFDVFQEIKALLR